jgi:ubiquinone/menaquinone biosynthesis C-methylase UbiE
MAWALDPEEYEKRVLHELVGFVDKDVLEVGCGDGRLTWRYAAPAATVLACDPKEDAIALARTHLPASWRGRVTFRAADITTMELPEAAFDIAIFARSI